MKRIFKFIDEVKKEFSKVTWLSRKEVSTSVIIVFVSVLIFSLFFVFVDFSIYKLINWLVHLGV